MKKPLPPWGLIILALLTWALYLKTLCPTIYIEDSGEFIASAYTLGISHPPGYSLFALAGKIFSPLPLGEIAFRVNLSAALLGVGDVILTAILLSVWVTYPLAILTALMLGGSRLWWSQAIQPEVYLLNGLFTLMFLWSWITGKRPASLALIWGLSLANHYLALALFPFILFSLARDRRLPRLLIAAFFLLLGLLVYLYLPLRGSANPAVSWRHSPASWSGLKTMLSRRQFKGIEFSHQPTFNEKLAFIGDFCRELAQQGTPLIVCLALTGVFILRRKSFLPWLLYLFLINSLGLILFLKFPYDKLKTYTMSSYYLVPYIILFILAAFGLNYLSDRQRRPTIILTLLLTAGLIGYHAPKLNQRSFYTTYDFGLNLINNTQGQGLVSVSGIYELFPLMYFKLVANRLPHLVVTENPGPNLARYQQKFPHIYFVRPPATPTTPAGLLYHLGPNPPPTLSEKHLRQRGLFTKNNTTLPYPETIIHTYYSRYYAFQGTHAALEKIKILNPELGEERR